MSHEARLPTSFLSTWTDWFANGVTIIRGQQPSTSENNLSLSADNTVYMQCDHVSMWTQNYRQTEHRRCLLCRTVDLHCYIFVHQRDHALTHCLLFHLLSFLYVDLIVPFTFPSLLNRTPCDVCVWARAHAQLAILWGRRCRKCISSVITPVLRKDGLQEITKSQVIASILLTTRSSTARAVFISFPLLIATFFFLLIYPRDSWINCKPRMSGFKSLRYLHY